MNDFEIRLFSQTEPRNSTPARTTQNPQRGGFVMNTVKFNFLGENIANETLKHTFVLARLNVALYRQPGVIFLKFPRDVTKIIIYERPTTLS